MQQQGSTISRQVLLTNAASIGREQQALNAQTGKALEGIWMGCVCQPKAAHFGLLAELRKKTQIQHSHT